MLMRLAARLKNLVRRRRIESEVDDELRFHVEMETEANRARGMSPDDARHAAMREFGGVTQAREAVRVLRASWLSGLWQDLRYSVRGLRRSPAFSAVAILVLTLGIGVNIAAFSVVNAAFFPKFQVDKPRELVYVFHGQSSGRRQVGSPRDDFQYFSKTPESLFADFTAHWGRALRVTDGDETTSVFGEVVLANYFDVLGTRPAIGTAFRPADDEPSNTDLVVVISHELWQQKFMGDPNVISRRIRIEDRTYAIVGIMPEGFAGLSSPWQPARLWITVVSHRGLMDIGMGTIARLKSGVTLDQARAATAVVSERYELNRKKNWPANRPYVPLPYVIAPIGSVLTPFEPDRSPIPAALVTAVLSVVAVVLIIAMINIAGVLAARGFTRTGELAVRQALGAGAFRVIRQLVVESTVLAMAGGAAGLLVARLLLGLYHGYTPDRFVVDTIFDWRVVLFTIAICLVAGALVGIAPALQAARVNVVSALGGSAASGTSTRGRRRLRYAILVPQVALSIALLVVAGVHARVLFNMEAADVGYRTKDMAVLRAARWDWNQRRSSLPFAEEQSKRAERDRAYYRAVAAAVRTVPVAGGAALTVRLPTGSLEEPVEFMNQDQFARGESKGRDAWQNEVSPGFFAALAIPLKAGRDFDDRDTREVRAVAIVSEALARELWPAGDAIGKSLAVFPPQTGKPPEWREVVGIVGETQPILQDRKSRPMVYTPLAQSWQPSFFSVVTGASGADAEIVRELKRAIISADTFAEVTAVQTMEEIAGELLYPRRAAASILLACGSLGLALASIGLYGVISHSVAQRLKEIGIRSTLGADRRDILKLVLREAAGVALLGAVPGLALGLVGLRVTTNMVGELPTFDALTFVLVPLMATLVVLAAAFIPARRASRADPMAILRTP